MPNPSHVPVTPAQLPDAIVKLTFELNLCFRAASLAKIPMHVDLVDRPGDTVHPNGYPEVRVRAGDKQWPL